MFARVCIVCALALWIGCGKRPTADASSQGAPSVENSGTNLSAPEGDTAQIAAVLAELTQAVRRYAADHQRVPQSFDELVQAGYLTRVPQAPSGKKFAIDKKLQVYLTRL